MFHYCGFLPQGFLAPHMSAPRAPVLDGGHHETSTEAAVDVEMQGFNEDFGAECWAGIGSGSGIVPTMAVRQ